MKTYRLHRSMGRSDVQLNGDNIIDAITNNFKAIAEAENVGNAAGYKLVKVSAKYNSGILGGKGGCEVYITATGNELAHTKEVGGAEAYKAWISGVTAEEIQEEYIFDLK